MSEALCPGSLGWGRTLLGLVEARGPCQTGRCGKARALLPRPLPSPPKKMKRARSGHLLRASSRLQEVIQKLVSPHFANDFTQGRGSLSAVLNEHGCSSVQKTTTLLQNSLGTPHPRHPPGARGHPVSGWKLRLSVFISATALWKADLPCLCLVCSHCFVLNQMPTRPTVRTELPKMNPKDAQVGLGLDFLYIKCGPQNGRTRSKFSHSFVVTTEKTF